MRSKSLWSPSKEFIQSTNIFDFISYLNVNDRLKFDIGLYNILDEKYFNYSTVRTESPSSDNLDRLSEPGRNFKIAGRVRDCCL